MQIQVWVPLVGVVLGGCLSYLAQASMQRRSDRRDQLRQANERAEARRAERMELLREFIRIAQQAERAAEDRDDSDEWKVRSLDIVDELWVCERMIHITFDSPLHELARAHVKALNHVLWREAADVSMWDYLEPSKVAFFNASREELARMDV